MVNALFSSKSTGTKHFQRSGQCKFGWDTIDDLYQRELSRVKLDCARMVPKLKETHCLRDAWTKLNMLPAKIMQVIMWFCENAYIYVIGCVIARTGFGRASLVYSSKPYFT